MRIDAADLRVVESPRREPFVIASGSATTATNVVVRLEAGGLVGYGNACPNSVTRETRDSIVSALETLAPKLAGREFGTPLEFADAMDAVLPGNPAAKAGLDIAFHDLLAKERGVPLYRYLGGSSRTSMPTDMTIGIMDRAATVEHARRWVAQGFRALKVKVGLAPEEDLARLRAVRDAVGPDIELRVDGNQGFSLEPALRFAREIANLGVVLFEQPLPATDLNGMKVLAENSPVPVMADEMVLTPKDAIRVRWGMCARAVNLKLMKHGGLQRAREVNAVCVSAGYPTMIGCMGESAVSVVAALHFALATENVRWADLDSHLNLVQDVTEVPTLKDGSLVAPSGPGLGLRVERW